jgi:2-polyprenyl-3-methyl-5-hydroxy-6-metoxy-1,4-benzoquinol methylase
VTTASRVAKRDVPCNLCGSELFDELYPDELGDRIPPLHHGFAEETSRTYRIVKCKRCGLVFTNPMPELSKHYTNTVDDAYVQSTPQRRKTSEYAVEVLARHKPSGRLLDIGCNTGVFLDAAAERYEVEGIELSEWSADIASERHKVHRQPIEELNLERQYDIVTMWAVIEHLEDPRAELEYIFDAMTPGGIAAFYTPDIDSYLARLLGKRWWSFLGMHLFYFSRRTLTCMLEEVGFEFVEYRRHRVWFQLFSLASSFNRYRIGRLIDPILTSKPLRSIFVPLELSGEMLLIVRKPEAATS